VVTAVFLHRNGPVEIEPILPEVGSLQPLLASALDDSLPSVGTYHRALARSPDELDAMLDKHTARSGQPEPTVPQVRAFIRLDEELDTLPGEL
jgi:hypothetical protein